MASAQGNGVFLVTQYVPAVHGQPLQQNIPCGQNARWLQKFIRGEPKSLGVVQIMIGIIHIALGVVLCFSQFAPIAVYSGIVFWAPIFFIISGGLSISAEKNGNRCQVKGALGMNTVSAVATSIAFIIYAIELSKRFSYYINCNSGYNSGYNSGFNSYNRDYCYQYYYASQAVKNGILAVLLILSLLELAISISTSAFGCKSVCGHSGSQTTQPMVVVQSAYTQDPGFQPMQTATAIPITQGMQLVGPGMTIVQGTPMVQGMPTSYIGMMPSGIPPTPVVAGAHNIGMMIPGIPSAPVVASEPIPTTETPPSYYKDVPGDV